VKVGFKTFLSQRAPRKAETDLGFCMDVIFFAYFASLARGAFAFDFSPCPPCSPWLIAFDFDFSFFMLFMPFMVNAFRF